MERTFAWLENFRRFTIDYEFHGTTAEAVVQLVFCKSVKYCLINFLNNFINSF
ncbi:hypothetical protein [Falsiporphyromonas endometrii]|uniref:Transposase n=1 Tax=Falsiporphyromonas endometrii TaxID=1387297 RepID=A0ABV9K6W2_9PORP